MVIRWHYRGSTGGRNCKESSAAGEYGISCAKRCFPGLPLPHNDSAGGPTIDRYHREQTTFERNLPILIALDLDGTLLTSDKSISPRTRQALDLLETQGHHIVIATGRPYAVMAIFCQGLRLTAPQVTLNGAVIHDPIAGRDLRRTVMAVEDVERAMAFFTHYRLPLALFTTDGLYLDQGIAHRDRWDPPPLPAPGDLADLGDVRDHQFLKVVTESDRETIDRLHPVAVSALGDSMYVTRTAPTLLEALESTVSKGAGLREVAEFLDVASTDIIAFGDSDNDLPMFEVAGVSVAMGNAPTEVQSAADMVTGTNEEDGVVLALTRLGLVVA